MCQTIAKVENKSLPIDEIEILMAKNYLEGLNFIFAYLCGNYLHNWKWRYLFYTVPSIDALVNCIPLIK